MQIFSTFKEWIKKEWKIWRYLWHTEIMGRSYLVVIDDYMFEEGDVVRMRTNERFVIVWKGRVNDKNRIILKRYGH